MAHDRSNASLTTRAVAVGVFCILSLPCCTSLRSRQAVGGPAACVKLDSLYKRSGFEAPMTMAGKATFDIEQYRVRGQFNLLTDAGGRVGFEFSSSSLFGSRREEISLSIVEGTIRVLDRERGEYYEGEEVDVLLRTNLEMDIDAVEILKLVLGTMPSCSSLEQLMFRPKGNGDVLFASRVSDQPVNMTFGGERRKLVALEWPVRFEGGDTDRLRVEYLWEMSATGNSRLKELILRIEEKGWRIKLRAES